MYSFLKIAAKLLTTRVKMLFMTDLSITCTNQETNWEKPAHLSTPKKAGQGDSQLQPPRLRPMLPVLQDEAGQMERRNRLQLANFQKRINHSMVVKTVSKKDDLHMQACMHA